MRKEIDRVFSTVVAFLWCDGGAALVTVLLHFHSLMCSSHFCRVRVTSPSSQSHLKFFESSQCQSHDLVESEPSHKNCWVASSHWFARLSQCRVTWNFTFFLRRFFAMKWHLTCYKMAPDRLENGAQHAMKWRPISWKMVPNVVLTSLIASYLCLVGLFSVCIFLVSFTLSRFKKSSPTLLQVLQPLS